MLMAVLDALPDPVVITDSAQRMGLVNQEVLVMFGYRSAELEGRPRAASWSITIGRSRRRP